MASILDQMDDAALLEKVLDSLENACGLRARVLDSDGEPVLTRTGGDGMPSVVRFFPFESDRDVGGLECAAGDAASLDRAEAQIQTSVSCINAILRRELEIQQLSTEVLDLSEEINFLFHLEKKMLGTKRLRPFCEMTLSEIAKKIKADHAFVTLQNVNMENMTACLNMSDDEASDIRGRHTVFDLASRRMDTVLSTLDNDMSVLVSPILVKDGHAGFMTFLRDKDKRFFTAYEKKFVGILNSGISSMIEALRLYDSLKELYLNTVKALAAAIDAKDQYTHGHSFRVARYTMAIAKAMDLSEDAVLDMEIAAFMHDLGKIGVPESVLNKKGKLTAAEYEEMKRHPHFTGRILEPIKLPEFIVTTALQHHERLDGSGYPLGLKGDKITLPARIVAVADVFDALTSDRPYRPALTVERALQHLVDGIDAEFDRDVVSALIRTLKEGTNIRELSDIYRDLKFTDIQHLNYFLVELADMLVK